MHSEQELELRRQAEADGRLRVQAEADLARSERRLKIATSAAGIGIWDWNLRTNEMLYSERARQICGFPPDQPVTYEQVRAVTHPDDLPATSAMARRALDPEIRSSEIYRYRIVRADTGEVRWVLAHGEASFGEVDGRIAALDYIGTLLDITEDVRAEEALVESEARLRLAVDASEMAVWELDLAAGQITHSIQLNAMFGFPPDARPSIEDLRTRYAPGERERIEAQGAEIRARGETQIQTEFRIVVPDGTEKWLLLRASLAPGVTNRIIGVMMDITDRRHAEERLRLVARELQHRMKNSLAIVQTIASQSFRGTPGPDAVSVFSARLSALAAATDIITANDWTNAWFAEVVERVTAPFRSSADSFSIEGEDVRIPSKLAIALGMALHELCTNAAKYGALSQPGGAVALRWQLEDDVLEISWRESGGPPVVPPANRGFGTRLLERGLFTGPDGSVELRFDPEGLTCRVRAKL